MRAFDLVFLAALALPAVSSDIGKPGGGAQILTGTLAALPAAGTAGNVYLPTDGSGYVTFRDSGAAWVPYNGGRVFTTPPTSGWSWVNQGSATITTDNEGQTLATPSNGSFNARLRVRNLPGATYTITANIVLGPIISNNRGLFFGLFNSATTESQSIFINRTSSEPQVSVINLNSPTSISGTPLSSAAVYLTDTVLTLRVTNNGTNRIWEIANGDQWLTLLTVGNTNFTTPDQAFFGVYASNDLAVSAKLIGWAE